MTERNAYITILAEEGPNGICWNHVSSHKMKGKLQFKDNSYRMIFDIDDGNLNLRFVETPGDAFWVNRKHCPHNRAEGWDPEFPVDYQKVTDDGRKLRVKNLNTDIAQYYFALRFQRPDGRIEIYDPMIDNKNGGAIWSDSLALTIAATTGIGVALWFLFGRDGKAPRGR